MRHSSFPVCFLLATVACAQPRTYIRCDRPITCSVSYAGDSVTLQLQTPEACDVYVWTGFEPTWAFRNGQKATDGWTRQGEGVVVHAAPGDLLYEFGRGPWPLRGEGPPVPVKVDGKARTRMAASFGSRQLEARGEVEVPLGLYKVTLVAAGPVPDGTPKLRIGGTEVSEWEAAASSSGRQALCAKSSVLLEGQVGLRLTWDGSFARSPVREVLVETATTATALAKVEPPDLDRPGTIIVEAEDFKREGGGGPVEVSKGEHADQHGGASIFSFGPGPGHWLEWEFDAPKAGKYALYARTATQEESALRSLTVDREPPFPAAELLQFPGTGGWARDDANQWAWTILAGADSRPPLELAAGEHRLRLTTIGGKHLNVDLLVLMPK
jgi:hypothetical protein